MSRRGLCLMLLFLRISLTILLTADNCRHDAKHENPRKYSTRHEHQDPGGMSGQADCTLVASGRYRCPAMHPRISAL